VDGSIGLEGIFFCGYNSYNMMELYLAQDSTEISKYSAHVSLLFRVLYNNRKLMFFVS
jgi:hypothetical protein